MIDWPNALAGFALGIVTTLLFWIPDRIRANRQRRTEVWEAWKIAMKELELLLWKPDTRGDDLYLAQTRYPIDHWRTVLDDRDGFKLFERVQAAYPSLETSHAKAVEEPSPENIARLDQWRNEWNGARIAFANYSRRAQSKGYNDVIRREQRQQTRRDLLRHPVKTVARLRSDARRRKSRTSAQGSQT